MKKFTLSILATSVILVGCGGGGGGANTRPQIDQPTVIQPTQLEIVRNQVASIASNDDLTESEGWRTIAEAVVINYNK